MKRIFNLLGAAAVALAAAGCAGDNTAVSLEQYSLLSGTGSEVLGGGYKVAVRLHGVTGSQGIVVRTSDVTYRPALNHLWSGALEDELACLMVSAMQEKHASKALQVGIDVMNFNGSLEGTVEIDALVTVTDGKKELWSQAFAHRSVQNGQGYPALVRELKRGWMEICGNAAGRMPGQ